MSFGPEVVLPYWLIDRTQISSEVPNFCGRYENWRGLLVCGEWFRGLSGPPRGEWTNVRIVERPIRSTKVKIV